MANPTATTAGALLTRVAFMIQGAVKLLTAAVTKELSHVHKDPVSNPKKKIIGHRPRTPSPFLTRLRLLWACLVLLTSILPWAWALPTNGTVTPVFDDGTVDLDVGQKTVISHQNWGLGVALIIHGLVQVFFGFKLMLFSLLMAGFASWAIASMLIMVAIRWDVVFTTFMPQHYYFWVWLCSGIVGAILSFRFWDLGVTFTGAFGGFALAMGIVAAANISITNAGRYVIMGILILSGAAFATFFERIFVILATSLGGSYMVMFGIDQFIQVGYREMIVVFDFRGKTFTYHPTWKVYVMLASSAVLAGIGIAWECWRHTAPFGLERRAVFRIYGRPFGKRPRKLLGPRIHHHFKNMGWYAYLSGCYCFERRTIEDVLYDDDNFPGSTPLGVTPGSTISGRPRIPIPEAGRPETGSTGGKGEASTQEPSVTDEGKEPTIHNVPISNIGGKDVGGEKIPSASHSGSLDSEKPIKSAPIHGESTSNMVSQGAASRQSTEMSYTHSHAGPAGVSTTSGVITSTTAPTTSIQTESTRVSSYNSNLSPSRPHSDLQQPSSIPTAESTPHRHHPLFSSNLGPRTVEMVHMVTDDMSPGNTIPRNYNIEHHPSTSPPLSPLPSHQESLSNRSASTVAMTAPPTRPTSPTLETVAEEWTLPPGSQSPLRNLGRFSVSANNDPYTVRLGYGLQLGHVLEVSESTINSDTTQTQEDYTMGGSQEYLSRGS
ncbi:hypothetical protein BGW38_000131 [Lunasporangiospora selenospora]|uniref:Transmembrane protein 198 n=1 Tax=Lunasporangiospora selenospora TaxID=979761 RepID=A0A9P6FXJ1_9FUNG|nr:hypothetical protein BGW38_000131 [Lunasporangiospora selenospora]